MAIKTIYGGGQVTVTREHGGGGNADFNTGDSVTWLVTYDEEWLSGNGIEVIAMGTDRFLTGTNVDGVRQIIPAEIVVGSKVNNAFCFLSLQFTNGVFSGIAFLSREFNVTINTGAGQHFHDHYRMLTPGALYGYDSDAYKPKFEKNLEHIEWLMDSRGEGGESMVEGSLNTTD